MNIYCVILTDNEGGVEVEAFTTFDGAKSHIIDGIMADDSYNSERRFAKTWTEAKLPCQARDDDGLIMLRRVEVRE